MRFPAGAGGTLSPSLLLLVPPLRPLPVRSPAAGRLFLLGLLLRRCAAPCSSRALAAARQLRAALPLPPLPLLPPLLPLLEPPPLPLRTLCGSRHHVWGSSREAAGPLLPTLLLPVLPLLLPPRYPPCGSRALAAAHQLRATSPTACSSGRSNTTAS